MSSDLFEGDRHSLVLTEEVPLAEPVEHTRTEISSDGVLDHLVLWPARPCSLTTHGVEHLVIELEGSQRSWVLHKCASRLLSAERSAVDGNLKAFADLFELDHVQDADAVRECPGVDDGQVVQRHRARFRHAVALV